MKRINFILFISIFLVFSLATYLQAEEISLTKAEAIEIALEENPEIQRLSKEVEIAEQGIEVARSNYWPNLDLGSSYTRLSEAPAFPLGASKNDYRFSLSLQQPIYLGGRIRIGYQLAELTVEVAEAELRMEKEELAYRVAENYYNVLKSQKLVDVYQNELERFDEYVRMAETNYQLGLATSNDILRANINYNQGQQALLRAENALELSKLALSNTLNLDHHNLNLSEELEWEEQNLFFEELRDYARANRVELKLLSLGEEAAELELEMIKGESRPNLSFSADYSVRDDSFFEVRDGDWSATIALNYNLFDGGVGPNQEKQQEMELSKVDINRAQLEDLIELELKESLLRFEESKNQLELMELNLEQAEQNLKEIEVRFSEGLITSLELMEAQNIYQETKKSYLEAIFDYNLVLARIDKVSAKNLNY